MFEDLYNRLKEKKMVKDSNTTNKLADESKLDAMAAYLSSKFAYNQEGIKEILRGAVNGQFNINVESDRLIMLNTLYDVINLETVNKYNNQFLEITEGLRNPLVVVTELSNINLNSDPEISVFIHEKELRLVDNFNEEASYVRANFGK